MTITLERGAAALNVDLPDGALAKMQDYIDLLLRWNKRFNLTAIRDRPRIVVEHLLDALSVVHALHGKRIIDVGTGAGLPGLILAISRPDCAFTLLDSNGKKTRFIREVVRALEIGNVEIVEQRCEDYRPGAGFDTVVCRAFAPLPRLISVAGHLRADDGILLAQKGLFPEDEVAELGASWQVQSTPIRIPSLAKTRHLLTLRPAAET